MHVLADALTSVLAIAALLAGRYLGLHWLDPAMGIVGAVVIARWSWSLMRDTAAVLLDRTNERMDKSIRYRVGKFGVVCLTYLHVCPVVPEAFSSFVLFSVVRFSFFLVFFFSFFFFFVFFLFFLFFI